MHKRWLLLILTLVGAALLAACQRPTNPLAMPDDGPPVPISEEAATSLEQKAAEAAMAAGPATVTVTQEEVTSYLALRLNEAVQQTQGTATSLTEPQVYFRADGSIVLRGNIFFENRRQPIRVVAVPSANEGSLAVDITEGRIGPVPVPGAILDQVEGQLAEAILAGQEYARLDAIQVGAGTLTLTGERAPAS